MTSFVDDVGGIARDALDPGAMPRASAGALPRLARVHSRVETCTSPSSAPALARALDRAQAVASTAASPDAGDRLAASVLAADAVVALATEGELEPADTHIVIEALAETLGQTPAVAALDLYLRAAASPTLFELPPLVAIEIQLRLLAHLDVATSASVWRREAGSDVECFLCVGGADPTGAIRRSARAAVSGRRRLTLVGRRSPGGVRTAPLRRFGDTIGALVVMPYGNPARDITAFVDAAAAAVGPMLERELLLERSAQRESTLVAASEKRLVRVGFDLHDGPIQDVLALRFETQQLRDQLYPFVLDSHRELAYGRFQDNVARLADVDLRLRELSQSLETKSVVSRPLSEIVHREVDAFARRSDITATAEIRGDPDTLSAAQRVAVLRAIQEGLANVRAHSGATKVNVRVRARRSSIEVQIVDDGNGFDVPVALARAAQQGRLGLVGMGERVRLLGGTFQVDSREGGPTTVRLSLPRTQRRESELTPR